MGGGAVEYGRGDCIRLWRRKIDKDKACEIAGFGSSDTDALCSRAWKWIRCSVYAFDS